MPIFLDKTGAPRRARGRDLHAILEISLVLVTARAARTELDDDLHPHLALGTKRRPARSHGEVPRLPLRFQTFQCVFLCAGHLEHLG